MIKQCLTVLLLTLGGLSQCMVQESQGFCDAGWTQYKNACYRKFDEKVTWPIAEATCLSHDSHLASIHSSEENDFIFVLMGSPSIPYDGVYWIGMHDSFVEGNYMHADGTKVTFSSFAKGQPDNYEDEDYISSRLIENGHMAWNDFPLEFKCSFVCKYYLGNRIGTRDEAPYGR